MRKELLIKTRTLAGSSDLTLLAPIKPGLVPSLESVTYKTRIQRLLKTLNVLRSSSHEYVLLRAFSDAVERVGKINSVRVAIVEPDHLLLSVTFDGTWQSYLRVLWQKVGALLDVIFCNTENYPCAVDSTFEAWAAWADRVQIETGFFYGMPETSVDDVKYCRDIEAMYRVATNGGGCPHLSALQHTVKTAEEIAWPDNDPQRVAEVGRQGLQALAALYRLTDLYVPATGEHDQGKYLLRAARNLLLEFVALADGPILASFLENFRSRFGKQLDWLLRSEITPPREVPALPDHSPPYPGDDVQGGIVRAYEKATHGCVAMLAFDNAAAVHAFLRNFIKLVTRDVTEIRSGDVMRNIALTYEGLRAAGLSETQLAYFPQEFREGMEARASILGDLRTNHPRRWRAPVRNWDATSSRASERVELNSIHAFVQLRIDAAGDTSDDPGDAKHPLHTHIVALTKIAPGVRVLSVQALRRHWNAEGHPQEHFGFADGHSDPGIAPPAISDAYKNQIHLGEILLGYDNAADFAVAPAGSDQSAQDRQALLKNGTFLVVRKLAQDVAALNERLDTLDPSLRDTALEKMMGRKRNGDPLITAIGAGGPNDFDYSFDKDGTECPFQSHIRRANPRAEPDLNALPGGRVPRILRRGMSYGPRYADDATAERGLFFMAYNASISEQFEVIQRWLSGGNSTGIGSAQSDPFVGVAPNGKRKHFRFEVAAGQPGGQPSNQVIGFDLDGSDDPHAPPRPFVRLDWGAYLFTPSITALEKISALAHAATQATVEWTDKPGWAEIQRLLALEPQLSERVAIDAWKALLEEPTAQEKFLSASAWNAIRNRGGVLRTRYGVLVADRALVMSILQDSDGYYSVGGYQSRLGESIGEIYLGRDRGAQYDQLAGPTNAVLQGVSTDAAFGAARAKADALLKEFIDEAKEIAAQRGDTRWDLTVELKEFSDKLLAALCDEWFGVFDGGIFERGGAGWDWEPSQAPSCPGHFTAPSRFVFQPHPGPKAVEYGCKHGQAVHDAMLEFVKKHRHAAPGTVPGADPLLARAIIKALPNSASDDAIASTLAGVMMGFLPTLDGNLRLVLNEWLRDNTFWSLRVAAADNKGLGTLQAAQAILLRPVCLAMQLRPTPELVWRTATRAHTLGSVQIHKDDRIVASLVSAAQQQLAAGVPDIFPIFGGKRTAGEPHPPHACPGYALAMGVLLGALSALVGVDEAMRPAAAVTALTLEGPLT